MNRILAHIPVALALLLAVLATLAAPARADNFASRAHSHSNSQATSAAQNAGNAQSINFNSDASGRQTIKSAPSVSGQGFYGSFSSDSCMVSGGGGVSIVGFGGQFATPVEDKNCNLRRNFERVMQASATTKDPVRALLLETAAVDILCQAGDETRQALARQGLCPEDKQPAKPVAQTQPARPWDDIYSTGG